MQMEVNNILCKTIEALHAQTTGLNPNTNITNKKRYKIIDLSGKEKNQSSNHIQIYIYEDGTIEKKIVLE